MFASDSKSVVLMNPNAPKQLKEDKLIWCWISGSCAHSNTYRSTAQCQLNGFRIKQWHPTFGDQTFLRDIQIEQIQCVVDCLDFAHLDKPILELFGGRNQYATSMVLCLPQHRVQIFDTCHHAHGHFTAIGRCLRAWVQCCTETFANLLYASFKLVALKEYDEHGFVDIVTL